MTNSATQAIRKTGLDFDAAEFATLSAEELRKMDAYWRASNYLSVGQIYLFDNPDLIVACVVGDGEAEVVMACCGDFPTLETLAAVDLIRKHIPELKVRAVNMIKRKVSIFADLNTSEANFVAITKQSSTFAQLSVGAAVTS